MGTTTNYGLAKPSFGVKVPTGPNDEANNLDLIDAAIKNVQDGISAPLAVVDMPDDGVDHVIAAKQGIVKLSHVADAGAYTMNESGVGDAGSRVMLVATTAQQHVVNCSKFNNDGTKPNLTFGGAIGDFVVLVSLGVLGWFIEASKNVTQGA